MVDYYCDNNYCVFARGGCCSYWDTSIELMKIRKTKCSMDDKKDYKIRMIMGE